MRIFIGFMLVLSMAGCKQNPELPAIISPYKIDIQQGNVVTQEMAGKLKAGMTRSQVRFVLGSPLVVDMFHSDRWDYIYLLQRQGRPDDRRRLTVIFDGDNLLRLEGDVVLTDKIAEPEPPPVKPPAAATPAPKPAATKPVAATPPPDPKKSADKPPVAAKPEAKPEAATGAKPAATAATKRETVAGDEASSATADAAKSEGAKAEEKKDAPKQRGPFGRMLEKIGL